MKEKKQMRLPDEFTEVTDNEADRVEGEGLGAALTVLGAKLTGNFNPDSFDTGKKGVQVWAPGQTFGQVFKTALVGRKVKTGNPNQNHYTVKGKSMDLSPGGQFSCDDLVIIEKN